MMQMTPENPPPTVLNYLGVLVRWRGFIIKTVLVSCTIVAVYSLVMPKTYSSSAVVMPARQESPLNLLEAASGGLLGFGFNRGSTEIYLLKAILESRTLRENIVQQFNLVEVYESRNLEEAVLELGDHITTTITEDNTLKIAFSHATGSFAFSHSAVDSVRGFVFQVARAIVQQLDRLNRASQGTEAREYREFIEERRAEIQRELAALEDSLGHFQKQHDVSMVDAQLRATLEAAAVLEADMIKLEIEYAMAETKIGPDNPMIKSLKSELEATKQAFDKSFGGRENERRYLMGYGRDLPALLKNYTRLMRDVEIQSQVFSYITTKWEESKLREAQDTPTIVFLDQPRVPDNRTAPRRKFMVVTTGVLMTLLTIILAFILDFFVGIRSQYPEEYNELTKWLPRKQG